MEFLTVQVHQWLDQEDYAWGQFNLYIGIVCF